MAAKQSQREAAMARNLLPWMLLLGTLVVVAVVLTAWRVAKWRQPGERWYDRLRRRRDDRAG